MSRHRQENTQPIQALTRNNSTSEIVQKARQTPDSTARNAPVGDLHDAVVEIRFLALSWLDDFEKELFEGKTIDELLNHNKYD